MTESRPRVDIAFYWGMTLGLNNEGETQPKTPGVRRFKLIGGLLGCIMRFLYHTARKRFTDTHNIKQFFDEGKPIIVAAWHGHNMMSPYAYLAHAPKSRTLSPIASASRDGSLAAYALASLGMKPVRGSSSKGGAMAFRQMLRIIQSGNDLAFTPDGPRGPQFSVADGVITAARMSGAPIVPMSFAAARFKRLGSWDRLLVPMPFTRLHFAYGTPIFVPRDASKEQLAACKEQLRDELMRIGELTNDFERPP